MCSADAEDLKLQKKERKEGSGAVEEQVREALLISRLRLD